MCVSPRLASLGAGAAGRMRVAKRWRKQFIPIVMLLAPTEDTRQYSIMYSIGSLLLQRALTRLGWDRPEKLFAQIHSDFA